MENFVGTEWENHSEEEIFLLHQNLVDLTIKKQLPNRYEFCKLHMIDMDDLMQLGNIGLLIAIRTFDVEKNSSFRTFAINNITWNILKCTKKDSLRTTSTTSYKMASITSLDAPVDCADEENETTLLDTLISNDNDLSNSEDNLLEEQVFKFLDSFSNQEDAEIVNIIKAKLKGETKRKIGRDFGISDTAVRQRLKTKKAQEIQKKLKEFIKNGAY